MMWARWIWDNPIGRWVAFALLVLTGWKFLEGAFKAAVWLASRGAIKRERERRKIEQDRALAERIRKKNETEKKVDEIRSTNARRDDPFDGMSDASRGVLFSD